MEQILYILPRGLAIGILISAPMGPIGMFVIQRTLSKGRWPAFFSGVGAAVSDLVYCLLAGLGLSFVTDFIEQHQSLLQVIGGIVLAAFGIYLFRKNPTRSLKPAVSSANNFWRDIATGFALTFSNPLILFFIIGLFARFNFVLPEYRPFHFVIGYLSIFVGALIWWYIVTLFVNAVRARFNVRSLWMVNRIIGAVLFGMAAFGVALAIKEYIQG
ncbi:MAG: LysE family translocator [Muribaculaceae bacterium]|nr:LysE family translocator [Muribaculaceae bacterium]